MMDLEAQVRLTEARRQNEALLRAREIREAHGLHFYRPHYKQHRFHEMGQVTGRYCRFGNRAGKTKCGAAEDIAWCYGGRVWYRSSFDIITRRDGQNIVVGRHEGRKDHPLVTHGIPTHPVKGLLVVSSWKKASEIFTNRVQDYSTCGELFQLIPKDAVGDVHSTQGNIDRIEIIRPDEFGGGVSILFIDTVESFKHNWRAAESSDFDFIHYDEPPPQKMFVANKRGLVDRNGKFWVNATPVEELWVNDEFCPAKGSNLKVDDAGLRFSKSASGGDRFIITATIFENPFISEAGRQEFISSLSREEIECRTRGLPINLAGLIYKEFVYDMHVLCDVPKGWEDYHLPPKGHTIRVAWDVHDAIPQALMFIATSPTGEAFVYDELFFTPSLKENAELLKEKLADRFVAAYLIDPRAQIQSSVTGSSVLDELMNWDFYFDLGSKDMTMGIIKTREKLDERRFDGQPTIYFVPTVTNTLREIMRYAYNPRTMRPTDKDDHMMENLRRLVLNGLDYVAPAKDSDYIRPRHDISLNELAFSSRHR